MMKVLSLKEPYATLVKEKKKQIETRSYATHYRGELYIHASCSKISQNDSKNKELMTLVESDSLSYGFIICKCKLVDCIYMTKEYVENMEKNDPEYLCGEYKEGRYAWILEEISPLSIPIPAKGQLGIWNYYDEKECMKIMEEIEYGWIDKNHHKYDKVEENFAQDYYLQTPAEIRKNKVGVCWDQVELERSLLQANPWNIKTYFIVYYDGKSCPTHTFLTLEKEGKIYWFEHAWEKFRGIHHYPSKEELLADVKRKFIQTELKNSYQKENLFLYEYKKPKFHISTEEFYHHCESGNEINLFP